MREDMKQLLREKGFKITNQRLAVLEALESCPGRHLTAEEIYEMVKQKDPEIGLATVYRTIQLYMELGVFEKINLDDGFVRYEIAMTMDKEYASKHHHHHLICTECGNVYSFEDDLLEDLEDYIKKHMDFEVENHEVKFYGKCRNCRKKKSKE